MNMNLKYKVISVDSMARKMVVRYYSDVISEPQLELEKFPTDVTITISVPTPSTSDLERMIKALAPVYFFQRKLQEMDPTINKDLSEILALLGRENLLGSYNLAPPPTALTGAGHVVVQPDGSTIMVKPPADPGK